MEVQFTRGNRNAAIEQCEDIIYNLTTLWGPLDPTTVEMSLVLSGLYAATGRYHDAMTVHEDILTLLLDAKDNTNHTQAAFIAKQHFEEIQRLHQSADDWFGAFSRYSQLGDQLVRQFGDDEAWADVQPLEDTAGPDPKASAVPSPAAAVRGPVFSPPNSQRGRRLSALDPKTSALKSPEVASMTRPMVSPFRSQSGRRDHV